MCEWKVANSEFVHSESYFSLMFCTVKKKKNQIIIVTIMNTENLLKLSLTAKYAI